MKLEQTLYLGLSLLDLIAINWFFICWIGYTFYSEYRAGKKHCLANALHSHRVIWMQRMFQRTNRVADAALLANLERNVAFFASSTLIILAGIITVLGSTDHLLAVMDHLPFVVSSSQGAWEVKLIVLSMVFGYAFFKFTWALRQYGFACVLVGSAPITVDCKSVSSSSETGQQRSEQTDALAFGEIAARVISRAAYAFNLGLRAYYFSLAYLIWFINPWAFMVAAIWVVGVLYRREFKSKALKALVGVSDLKPYQH